MEILVIRHGDAVEQAPGLGDPGRWLTGEGRKRTRQVANWLTEHDERRPVEVWTSPIVRAVQTAEIVADAAGLTDEVSVHAALSTAGNATDTLHLLARYQGHGPLALVGHEPTLSSLAVSLLGKVHWPGFAKSSVLGVTWNGHGTARFRFLLNPKSMNVTTDLKRLKG